MQEPNAKRILVDLVNVNREGDPDNRSAAQQFLDRYEALDPRSGDPVLDVLGWAKMFRVAWTAKSANEIEAVSRYLDNIFKADVTLNNLYKRPAIAADFATGNWEPKPRYLLDRLGLQLMESRKMLHVCERPECGRYFIKNQSRNRYCTLLRQWERELDRVGTCAEVMRRRNQYRSVDENRETINARRRKPKSKKGRAA